MISVGSVGGCNVFPGSGSFVGSVVNVRPAVILSQSISGQRVKGIATRVFCSTGQGMYYIISAAYESVRAVTLFYFLVGAAIMIADFIPTTHEPFEL